MGLAIAEPCYVYIVRSEYVRPGCCGSVSVRALYPGVRRCEDSTWAFEILAIYFLKKKEGPDDLTFSHAQLLGHPVVA